MYELTVKKFLENLEEYLHQVKDDVTYSESGKRVFTGISAVTCPGQPSKVQLHFHITEKCEMLRRKPTGIQQLRKSIENLRLHRHVPIPDIYDFNVTICAYVEHLDSIEAESVEEFPLTGFFVKDGKLYISGNAKTLEF